MLSFIEKFFSSFSLNSLNHFAKSMHKDSKEYRYLFE